MDVKGQYVLYSWNSLLEKWVYMNSFKSYSDARDELERLHSKWPYSAFDIRWEEYL